MRNTILLSVFSLAALGGCNLIEDAQADKPNGTQKEAIGDLFGQGATIADVIDDPAGASESDIADIMTPNNVVLAVYPDQRDVVQAAAFAILQDRLYLGPQCNFSKTTMGERDLLTFYDCDVPLQPDGDCSFAGHLEQEGDLVSGYLTVGNAVGSNGSANCPDQTLDFLVNTANEVIEGLCAWQVYNELNSFYSYSIFNGIGQGECGLPASGSLEVGILPLRLGEDIRFGGVMLNPYSLTFGFRNNPCGLIITDEKNDSPTDPRPATECVGAADCGPSEICANNVCMANNAGACASASSAADLAYAGCTIEPDTGDGPTCEDTYEDVGSCDYTAYFECIEAAANGADLGDCTDADALGDYTSAIADCDPNPVDC